MLKTSLLGCGLDGPYYFAMVVANGLSTTMSTVFTQVPILCLFVHALILEPASVAESVVCCMLVKNAEACV